MHALTDKLLALFMALLLGLSPMQAAVSAVMVDAGQTMAIHEMSNHTGAMDMAGMASAHDCCEQAMKNVGCPDGDCSSSHCASCVIGLVAAVYPAFNRSLSCEKQALIHGSLRQAPSSLYRPPRA